MKIKALTIITTVVSMLNFHQSAVHAQGVLTPPGAPSPTMKSLAQIEPRTPISSLPFTISSSGSYYVTTNLIGVGSLNGITINASDVTVDLNGFALRGAGLADSIYVGGSYTNISIFNGSIDSWNYGVDAYYGGNSRNIFIQHLSFVNCSEYGIVAQDQITIRDCTLIGNNYGIYLSGGLVSEVLATGSTNIGIEVGNDGIVENCRANNNGSYGIQLYEYGSVIGCIADNNDSDGIYVQSEGIVKNCRASFNGDNGIEIDQGSVSDCSADNNTQDGVSANGTVKITGSTASSNGGYGFILLNHGVISDCVAEINHSDNFNLDNSCSIVHCSANQSQTGSGFVLNFANVISDCTAYSNKVYGVNSQDRGSVLNCNAMFNGLAGIRSSYIGMVKNCQCDENAIYGIISDAGGLVTISQNHCAHNGTFSLSGNPTIGAGIFITNSVYCNLADNTVNFGNYGIEVAANMRCLIIRNSAIGNTTTNFLIGSGNSFGPIVNVAGVGDISSTTGSTHPAANFSY